MKPDTPPAAAELRRRAEDRLQRQPPPVPAQQSAVDTQRLLQELQVHQIELEMQNEELRNSRVQVEAGLARYTDLYDFAPVGYFTLERDTTIAQTNLAGARLLGLERARLMGRRFGAFVAEAHLPGFKAFLQLVLASRTNQTCEVDLVKQDQTLRTIRIDATPSPNGQACSIAVMDITERKQAEQAQIESRQAAEAANLAKSSFLSSMSHELRTPLNAVLGYAQLLGADTHVSEDTLDSAAQIEKAGRHLLALVNGLLDLATIESCRMEIRIVEVELAEVLADCLPLVEVEAQARGIALELPTTSVLLRADRTRLTQVLLNLLSNAVKYNRDGGSVAVRGALRPAGRYRITVTDTGLGIAATRIGEAFQPFNRLGAEGGSVPGTGIGLTIAKTLVELMAGTIGVESVVGEGSSFWVELPLAAGAS